MVISCSAYNCRNRQNQVHDKLVSFHRFPLKNKTLLQKWMVAMRRKKFVPTKYTYICSDHFTPDDYELRPDGGRKTLKINSVPSIFNFPDCFPLQEEKPPCSGSVISPTAVSTSSKPPFSRTISTPPISTSSKPSCNWTIINPPISITGKPPCNRTVISPSVSTTNKPSCSRTISSPIAISNQATCSMTVSRPLFSTSDASDMVFIDHNYPSVMEDKPRKLQMPEMKAVRRRIKTIHQKLRRKTSKIEYYKIIIERLKQTCPECGS